MVPGSSRLRLLHIRDAIVDIKALTSPAAIEAPRSERLNRLALERAFEIVSEASRHLPDDLLARHPTIPWRKIAAIGNILRHEYQRVDPDLLRKIASDDLPALERVCLVELDRIGPDVI